MTEHGLAAQLAFSMPTRNLFRRSVGRLVATPMATPLLVRFLGPADETALRLTRRRWSVAGLLAGQPVITLVTSGAKTGQRRSTVLNAFLIEDDLAVLGTNFGRPNHPSWVHNLTANPAAEVIYGETTALVTAQRMDRTSTDSLLAKAISVHAGYARYRARVTSRDILAFRLRPR